MILLSHVGAAQTTISGRAVELETFRPMEDVFIEVLPPDNMDIAVAQTWTDSDGFYSIVMPAGTGRIRATYHEGAHRYRLWSPVLEVVNNLSLINFELPTALKDYFQNTLEPDFSNPKTLSVVTGYLKDGRITDTDGHVIEGGDHSLSIDTKGILGGFITHGRLPVSDASISLSGTSWRTQTDSTGRFRIECIDPGSYGLHIINEGETLNTPHLEINAGLNHFQIDLDLNQ